MKKVPKELQSVLWSADINSLDLEKDRYYIIHQILIYGRMENLKWLFDNYNRSEIVDVFLKKPYKNYPEKTFYFIKNFLLNIKKGLNKDDYVTSISGPVRQRTARNI